MESHMLYQKYQNEIKNSIQNKNSIYLNNFFNNKGLSLTFKEDILNDLIDTNSINVDDLLDVYQDPILNKSLCVYCINCIVNGNLEKIKSLLEKFDPSCLDNIIIERSFQQYDNIDNTIKVNAIECIKYLLEDVRVQKSLSPKLLDTESQKGNILFVDLLLRHGNMNPNLLPTNFIDKMFYRSRYHNIMELIIKSDNKIIKNNNQVYLEYVIVHQNFQLFDLMLADNRFDVESIIPYAIEKSWNNRVFCKMTDKMIETVKKCDYDSKRKFNTRLLFIDGYYHLSYLSLNNNKIDSLSFKELEKALLNKEVKKSLLNKEVKKSLLNKHNHNIINLILTKSIKQGLKIEPIAQLIIDILWTQYGYFLLNPDILQFWPYDISWVIINLLIHYC